MCSQKLMPSQQQGTDNLSQFLPRETYVQVQDTADKHRLLNLVPTPFREIRKEGGALTAGSWEAGYALSPATENWAMQVLDARSDSPALAVGFVGATSAGKSWLISKLQSGDGARPSKLEGPSSDVLLQSVTSDIDLYVDPVDGIYYVDFEGTHGTQPLHLRSRDIWEVVQQCSDMSEWECKRRQTLKDSIQPAVAYLMCNIVIFLTREKLVCRRALEECEQFAWAANKRVLSALPPALIIVQNCCRPSEGFFDVDQCTQAFRQAHKMNEVNGMTSWEKYFRSIDCFCIPDEFTFCKRSGFDGEEVCTQVIDSLRTIVRQRLAEDTAARLQNGVQLTQLQWFPILSTLCSIINDRESVEMASIYIHASAAGNAMADLKSTLLQLMNLKVMEKNGFLDIKSFEGRLGAAIGIVARFAVLRDLSSEDLEQVVAYMLDLFPCGAEAPPQVERTDGRPEPAICGQNRLFHTTLHRSSVCVRTVDPEWLQGVGEWLTGGVTFAWPGSFHCHPDVSHNYSPGNLRNAIEAQISEYRIEKCLEGMSAIAGAPWVLKAYNSLRQSGMEIRKDTMKTCTICSAKGVDPGVFWRMWMSRVEGADDCLAVCGDCHDIMEKHGVSVKTAKATEQDAAFQEQRCDACPLKSKRRLPSVSLGGLGRQTTQSDARPADHRLHPCKCTVCAKCAETIALEEFPTCPVCFTDLQWFADERALLVTGWRVARGTLAAGEKSGGFCVTR